MITPAHRHLAAWLLEQELGDAPKATTRFDAAERVCQELCRRLAELVTVEGYFALLARAVHLARGDFPFLQPIRASTDEACLGVLRRPLVDVEPSLRDEALTAVIAGVLGLLTTFIGDDLALRVVNDVWPDASYGQQAVAGEEMRA